MTPVPDEPSPTERNEHLLQVRWVASSDRPAPVHASTPAEAMALLDRGSLGFAALGSDRAVSEIRLDPEALGFVNASDEDGILNQEPFAAVLACSDSRVPIEFALGRAANDLFVVRVAGNVPGAECLGSMQYAADHLPRVQLFTVIGHSHCGAVTAAVDAFLHPETYLPVARMAPLRQIVDALFGAVRLAAYALHGLTGDPVFPLAAQQPHLRAALIAVSASTNAALSAHVLARDLERPAAYGVYDLARRSVGTMGEQVWQAGLRPAPESDEELQAAVLAAARGHLAEVTA